MAELRRRGWWRGRGRGISLVELLVVMAIIVVVAGMILATMVKVMKVVNAWR